MEKVGIPMEKIDDGETGIPMVKIEDGEGRNSYGKDPGWGRKEFVRRR